MQVFMGDDRRFVVARRGVVCREHCARFKVWIACGTIRLIARRTPKRFWTGDRRYYWDVHAFMEIRGRRPAVGQVLPKD